MVLVSLVVLILGGMFESLLTLGIGILAMVLSVGRVWKTDPSHVLRFHLPIAIAILMISVGFYLELVVLSFAGVVLQLVHAGWVYFRDDT